MNLREKAERLHRIIQKLGPNPDPEEGPVLLTGWVLVSSWMNGEGESFLSRSDSPDLPYWVASGLLSYADSLEGEEVDV